MWLVKKEEMFEHNTDQMDTPLTSSLVASLLFTYSEGAVRSSSIFASVVAFAKCSA